MTRLPARHYRSPSFLFFFFFDYWTRENRLERFHYHISAPFAACLLAIPPLPLQRGIKREIRDVYLPRDRGWLEIEFVEINGLDGERWDKLNSDRVREVREARMTRAGRMLDYRVKLIMKIESVRIRDISFEGCSFPIPIRTCDKRRFESETRFESE